MFVLLVLISFTTIVYGENLGKLEVISDLLPEDCFVQQLEYFPDNVTTGVLPHCGVKFTTQRPCDNFFNPTAAAYKKLMLNKPTSCNKKDGKFNPKQCKGEPTTGRCFCFNDKGKRIYGQEWWSKADNMTCSCSRRKYDMNADSQNSDIFFNSLHCNLLGNYESMQCDAISEQCWCADEFTGALKSPVVPMVAMTKLACYDPVKVGSQYMRQCENQKYAQKNTEYVLSLHGTASSYGDFVCDEDGAYGVYTIIEGATFCSWRDNSKISSYQNIGPDRSTLNCNCARDKKYYSSIGKQHLVTCAPNGNYQSLQQLGSTNYCVDNDGFKKNYDDKVKPDDDCLRYTSFDD